MYIFTGIKVIDFGEIYNESFIILLSFQKKTAKNK